LLPHVNVVRFTMALTVSPWFCLFFNSSPPLCGLGREPPFFFSTPDPRFKTFPSSFLHFVTRLFPPAFFGCHFLGTKECFLRVFTPFLLPLTSRVLRVPDSSPLPPAPGFSVSLNPFPLFFAMRVRPWLADSCLPCFSPPSPVNLYLLKCAMARMSRSLFGSGKRVFRSRCRVFSLGDRRCGVQLLKKDPLRRPAGHCCLYTFFFPIGFFPAAQTCVFIDFSPFFGLPAPLPMEEFILGPPRFVAEPL